MGVNIIPATIDDEDRVFDFLQKHFYPDEPLNSCLKRIPKNKKECPVLSLLLENLSLLAVEEDNPDEICGIFLNKQLTKHKKDKTWENLLYAFEGTVYGKILKFLDYTNSKFDDVMSMLWEQTQTNTALDACVTVVRSDCRRQHIGSNLMEHTLQIAKKNKIKWITIKCTSGFSAALAQKYGFSETYYLPYRDYKDKDGEIVFNIEKPHIAFKAYTKYLED